MEITRRSFLLGSSALVAAGAVSAVGLSGCSSAPSADEGTAADEASADEATGTDSAAESSDSGSTEEVDSTVTFDAVDVETATADEVQAAIDGNGTILVDARPQEAFSGWALEGAKNGGHLKGAKLFSERWINMEYAGSTPRATYLKREMDDQGITSDATVIVYDYAGNLATTVAQYLISQGVSNVKVFQANELIDDGSNVEAYENYQLFVPSEIVKSVSDYKTGKETKLSDEAQALFGDRIDDVVLIDVSWGNIFTSGYFSQGHVPGSIHVNSDCYERPRVYIPEKRSDYAKEWRKIPLEEFRDELCPLYGLTKDSIVILSSYYMMGHARLGLYTKAVGIPTYVMAGGLDAWIYNGYELDTDPSTLVVPESVDSFGSDTADKLEYNTEDVIDILDGKQEGQIVDNRSEDEWNGEYSGYSYHDLAGRIDGSIWCLEGSDEDGEFFQNCDGTARTHEECIAYLESNGLDTSKPMVFFCGDSAGASIIKYWCDSVDVPNMGVWTQGWIPWSNEGHEFIDHNGTKVHYDRWQDTLVDEDGNDVRDGVNILDTPEDEQ